MVNLKEYKHPNKDAEKEYNQLIGINEQKKSLISTLELLLNKKKMKGWLSKHHSDKLTIIDQVYSGTSLVILSGDVGCGKTALAQSIATPLAVELKENIFVYETPSNIRGSGLVGEISNRITEAFEQTKKKVKDGIGILIIDEADDIATSRSQNQAHHEDRAGLNVLIKQIDSINKEKIKLAVILITNRIKVLDPAIRRRTALHLTFDRPKGKQLKEVLEFIFSDVKYNSKHLNKILETIDNKDILYSYSDLIQRVAKQAIYKAIELDKPFSMELFETTLNQTEPTPLIIENE